MEDSVHSSPTARLKRKRPNPDGSAKPLPPSASTQLNVTRSADFWYDDRTIILQAEETQFRVHCGILSKHSTFFADMFKIPQPENEPLIDGCPVVYMHDAAEDWENMLMVMYQPMKAHPLLPTLPTRRLLSMLRLGKKYQFDAIFDSALTRLKSELPISLNDYERANGMLHPEDTCMHEVDDCYSMVCRTPDLFELINVAVELNIGIVLPGAYYLACMISTKAVLNGGSTADGAITRLNHIPQEIVLVGRDNVRKAIMDNICPWVYGRSDIPIPSKECEKPGACLSSFTDTMKVDAYERIQYMDISFDSQRFDKLCRVCLREVVDSHSASRDKFWDSLPSYFNLPAWDVLKAQ